MIEPNDFKKELVRPVWEHGKNLFSKLVFFIIASLAAYTLLMSLLMFRGNVIGSYLNLDVTYAQFFLPLNTIYYLSSGASNIMVFTWNDISNLWVIPLTSLLFWSWFYNVVLMCSERLLLGESFRIESIINKSLNKYFIRIAMASFLVMLAHSLSFRLFLQAESSNLSDAVRIGLLVVWLILSLKFFAYKAAIVHGKLDSTAGINFSFKNLTFVRALKLAGIALVFIAIIVFSLIQIYEWVGMMGPRYSSLIIIAYSYILIVFSSPYLAAASSAIFYRYASFEVLDEDDNPVEEDKPDISSHLIDEDLG